MNFADLYSSKNLKTAGVVAVPTILAMTLVPGSTWIKGGVAALAALVAVAFVVPKV